MQVLKSQSVNILFSFLLFPPLLSGLIFLRPISSYKCIRVLDGDTIIVLRGSEKLRIRLAYIDAPEKSQKSFDQKAIGVWSKLYLSGRISDKFVNIKILKKDLYGRLLGEVYFKNESINEEMVEKGLALAFMNHKKLRFNQAEYRAKVKKLGIWKTAGFYAPQRFRQISKRN